MAIYAYKCDVPKAQLRKDMQIAFEDLQMVQHENALTEDDIKSALEAYDREYYNFTISEAIGIPMKAADGRPTAQMKVYEWRKANPSGKKADCHKDTGLDPKTIRKWWETK